jgi:signal peptidase I
MRKEYDIDLSNGQDYLIFSNDSVMLNLSTEAANEFGKGAMVKSMRPLIDRNAEGYAVAPYVVKNRWTIDNYGPIWIPQKNKSIMLNDSTYAIYQRAIRVYEGNELVAKDGKYFVNGAEASSYTFKMDYFWMMGDNRHGSQDSRFWGFVPEDRIVGKAWMIWFSWENGPRWRRLFNIVK